MTAISPIKIFKQGKGRNIPALRKLRVAEANCYSDYSERNVSMR